MEKILSMNLLKKYRLQISAIVLAFVVVGLGSAYIIKPRFKVSSVISISPSYFQNSLMREFLSEVYDPTELRSQRQSILSEALDKNFLDEISKTAGLMSENETLQQAALRRTNLLNSIEIISLQLSDFQISVTDTDRERAILLNQKVIDNILTVLKQKRTKTLLNLKSAIAMQLDTMIPTKGLLNAQSASNPEALKVRIDNLEAQISQQQKTFSASHPMMKEQKKKLTELKNMYASIGNTAATNAVDQYEIKNSNPEKAQTNSVYEDLSRKYRYLNIVLLAEASPQPSYFSVVRSPEYPISAIWPKKGLFLVWSVLLGLLVSLVYISIKEFSGLPAVTNLVQRRKYSVMNNVGFVEDQQKEPALNHDIQP